MVKYSAFTSEKCIEMRLSFLENRFSVVVVVLVAFIRLWPACFGFKFPKILYTRCTECNHKTKPF